MSTKKIATYGVLAALSIVLLFFKFPIPMFMALEYDFADVPIIICTTFFGVMPGLLLTAIVCLAQGFLSASSGIIGVAMHFVATGSFVLVYGLIFRMKKNLLFAIIGDIMGIITWVTVMVGMNIWLTPIFLGIPRASVYPLLLPIIVPFNAIKASVNSILAITLASSLDRVLKLRLIKKPKAKEKNCT
ncbi:MAG: ECF transporter S component [Clostridia bacterium]